LEEIIFENFNISENKNNIISVESAKVLRYIYIYVLAFVLDVCTPDLRLTPFFIHLCWGGGFFCFFLFVSLKYLFGSFVDGLIVKNKWDIE